MSHNIPIDYVGIPSYEKYIRKHGYSLSEMIHGVLLCFRLDSESRRLERIQSTDSCINKYLDYIETASYVKLLPNGAGPKLKKTENSQKKKKLDHDFFYKGLREFCVQEVLDAYIAEIASINVFRFSSRKIKSAAVDAVRKGKTREFYCFAVKNIEEKDGSPKISFMDKFYDKPLKIILGSNYDKITNSENMMVLKELDEIIQRH